MNLIVARFFMYHHIVHRKPSFQGKAIFHAQLEYFGDAGEYSLRAGDVRGPVEVVVDCGKCFHMTQVSSGWGSGSGLTPGLEHAA